MFTRRWDAALKTELCTGRAAATAAAPFYQAVAIQHGMDGAFGGELNVGEAAQQPPKRCALRLEDDLQTQLHVECFTRTDTGSSIEVTDGVGDDAAAWASRAYTRCKIDPVKGIEHLDAELGPNALCDRNTLEDRQIQVREAWAIDLVPAEISVHTRWRRKGGRIDPGDTVLVEGMGDASKRVTDQVNIGANSIERLSTVEGHETVDGPPVSKDLRAVRGTGNVPRESGREVVSRVEVTVAILSLEVGAVERERATIGCNFVERVRPGVDKLRAQSVPSLQAQGGLKRVVVGRTDAVELVDTAVVRVLADEIAFCG